MDNIVSTQSKVHFFELYAADSFSKYLRNAILYTLSIIVEQSTRLVGLRYHKDSLALLADLVLNTFYMFKKNGFFPEFFYDIKRVAPSSKSKLATLLVTYGIAFIFSILDSTFKEIKRKMHEEPSYRISRKAKVFLGVYPFLNLLYYSIDTAIKARYLIDDSYHYYSIPVWILRQKYDRVSGETESGFFSKYSIFLLFMGSRFLDWYFDRTRHVASIASEHTIGKKVPYEENESEETFIEGICPLCNKKAQNPAFLASAGLVYCYSCLYGFITANRRCPRTGIKTEMGRIHKLYH